MSGNADALSIVKSQNSFLNTPLLDRAYPPWEAYVIEGIEQNRFAILIRIHHALIDGGSAW